MELSLLALALGFLLDLLFGDPRALYHPVRMIGNLIAFLEKALRKLFCVPPQEQAAKGAARKSVTEQKKEQRRRLRELLAGVCLAVLVVVLSSGIPMLLLLAAQAVHPYLRLVLETFFCWQLLAAKSLKKESMKVFEKLKEGDLEGSRAAVSMIVGRDTENLDAEGVAKAAVETVAENTSDGVIAPMLYMALGGAALGFFYKAVNTMDSMIAYKNSRYLYFGRFAARLDDVLNFLPSRISAGLLIVAAYLLGLDGKNAVRIFLRDRLRHASPNSAQCESVMAGALNVRLAGDAWYFGELHEKETLGDDIRPIEAQDIARANRMMYLAAALMETLVLAAFFIILYVG